MGAYKTLIKTGIKLSSEKNLNSLLSLILKSAREVCHADAGTLYLKKKKSNCLNFEISQNSTLEKRIGKEKFENLLNPHTLKISEDSLAGWSAKNKAVLNIKDVYKNKEKHYSLSTKKYDKKTGYKCHSILCVPLIDRDKNLVGVFELINKKKGAEISSFSEEDEKIALALASQAAVSIKNTQLTDELQMAHKETILKLGLVAEYKDEETGEHIKRVAEYSKIIGKGLKLNEKKLYILYKSSPLHDIGKIGTPD